MQQQQPTMQAHKENSVQHNSMHCILSTHFYHMSLHLTPTIILATCSYQSYLLPNSTSSCGMLGLDLARLKRSSLGQLMPASYFSQVKLGTTCTQQPQWHMAHNLHL